MIPWRLIAKKRDGGALQEHEVAEFFGRFLDGGVADYHMAAFLMAVVFQGMESEELDALVRVMLASGETLDLGFLGGPSVDKHSTGGVGDKASLVVAPLAAELGVWIPMMSGRGLGHTAGTLDKLEAIPGFRTGLALEEFLSVLSGVGCAMIGQTDEIAPLDRRLYALRDVTATVPAVPLIAASIMSKKLAEGLSGLVLDVKVGSGALIPEEDRALELARTMVEIGARRGLPTVALLTAMDRPLGRMVGHGLETLEAVRCLKGEGPSDLEELSLTLAAEMAALASGTEDRETGRARAEEALGSGRALERFRRLVSAQGGDPRVVDHPEMLATAPARRVVTASVDGPVSSVRPRPLGYGLAELGGGRAGLEQSHVEPGVGFEVHVRTGESVRAGAPLATVHGRNDDDLERGERAVREAVIVGEEPAAIRPLVSHRVTEAGIAVL